MKIKSFIEFNEDLEVYATKMPYGKSLFLSPMKDVDLHKSDELGKTLTAEVPQFDPVKTLAVMLEDGNLVNRAAQMFPDTDLKKSLKNPNVLGDAEIEKLQFVYDEIILKDYTLRTKYDMIPDQIKEKQSLWDKYGKDLPIIFKSTIYRIPTDEELIEVDEHNLNADDLMQGFTYTMVGRGISNEDNKEKIVDSLKRLHEMFPKNDDYVQAYEQAKNIKIRFSDELLFRIS